MKNLQWSRYNFLFNSKKYGKLLYNSYTNGFLKLNNSLFEDLKTFSKGYVQESLERIFSKEELDYLKNNYILTENDDSLVEQMHYQSMQRIYDKKHLVLTNAPTQNCNFNCSYCYEKWRTPGSMSNETEEALLRYLEYQKFNFGLESINLTWYGGEPLLEHRRIKSLGEKIIKIGLNIIENEIVTNGYLFDKKRITILNEVGIDMVQITLDGFKKVHDKRRPLINGKGTFDKIIKNLDNFFKGENTEQFVIAIRVNIDKTNKDNYIDIYKWLKNRYPQENLIVYPGWIHLDENDEKNSTCFSRNESTDFGFELLEKHGIIRGCKLNSVQ